LRKKGCAGGNAEQERRSIFLGQQEEHLKIVRSHYGGFALQIGFCKCLRKTGLGLVVPFEIAGVKTGLILLNIIHFLLLGGTPEKFS
jgi:hypothetical protein